MSSVSLSASGARALSTTHGGPDYTNASVPTKADDNIHTQFGPGETRLILPLNARIEVIAPPVKEDGTRSKDRYLRLVLPTGGGTAFTKAVENVWPHQFINVGKHITDPYAGYDVVEEPVEVGTLIPPTE